MKIKELILEYNLQNLLSLFQEKYKETKQKDPSNTHDTLDQFIKSIEDPLRRDNKFQFIDPYMKWIVQRYVTGKLNRYEDVTSKVVPGLLKYDSLKRKTKLKPEHKDINGIKDINELLDVLDQYKEEDTKSDKEKEKEIEENFYRNGEAILVYNDQNYKIVVPKSERASCFFGRNTRWCTAATKGENYFDSYNSKGNLYVIIIKKENKRFQFHFETNQFMDERDEPIDIINFFEKYPKIKEVLNNKIKNDSLKLYFKDINEYDIKDLLSLAERKPSLVASILKRNKNNKNLYNKENLKKILKINEMIINVFYENLSDKNLIIEILEDIFTDENEVGFNRYEIFHNILGNKNLREIFFNNKKITNKFFNKSSRILDVIEMYPEIIYRIDFDHLFEDKNLLVNTLYGLGLSLHLVSESKTKKHVLFLLKYLLNKILDKDVMLIFKDNLRKQKSFIELLDYSYGIHKSNINDDIEKVFKFGFFDVFDKKNLEEIKYTRLKNFYEKYIID